MEINKRVYFVVAMLIMSATLAIAYTNLDIVSVEVEPAIVVDVNVKPNFIGVNFNDKDYDQVKRVTIPEGKSFDRLEVVSGEIEKTASDKPLMTFITTNEGNYIGEVPKPMYKHCYQYEILRIRDSQVVKILVPETFWEEDFEANTKDISFQVYFEDENELVYRTAYNTSSTTIWDNGLYGSNSVLSQHDVITTAYACDDFMTGENDTYITGVTWLMTHSSSPPPVTNFRICFYYDGKNIRLGATHPELPEIKALAVGIRERIVTSPGL